MSKHKGVIHRHEFESYKIPFKRRGQDLTSNLTSNLIRHPASASSIRICNMYKHSLRNTTTLDRRTEGACATYNSKNTFRANLDTLKSTYWPEMNEQWKERYGGKEKERYGRSGR